MESHLLNRLLEHDAWATDQVLQLARDLSESQLDQPFELGHRTIRQTLDHLIWNLECWTDLMNQREVRNRSSSSESLEALLERHVVARDELRALASRILTRGDLNATFVDHLDEPPRKKTYGGCLVHLATHSMHHRAQLLYFLRRVGVDALPELDTLTWERECREEAAVSRDDRKVSMVIDDRPTDEEVQYVDDQLEQFNRDSTGLEDFQALNLVVRGTDQSVIAGVKACTGWEWLYVQILWVHTDFRKQGWGGKLLSHAEAKARGRGCRGACLSSFSFQAPDFYTARGYQQFGEIEDYPVGGSMLFFKKTF